MNTQRFVTERLVTERIVTERLVTESFVTERLVTESIDTLLTKSTLLLALPPPWYGGMSALCGARTKRATKNQLTKSKHEEESALKPR